jgi:PAS domain S-box-containing protein
MPAKRWRPWLWGVLCAAFSAGLYAAYSFVRQELFSIGGRPDATPSILEQVVLVGLLLVPAVLVFAHGLRLHYRSALSDLAHRLDEQRANPALNSLRNLPNDGPANSDLQPLLLQITSLVTCYRSALAERVERKEPSLRPSIASAENDRSFSANPSLPGAAAYANAAQRMIARLAPTLHWIAATPALQQALGRSLVDLNAKPFLDLVHPDDQSSLGRALQEALKDGEGHNITFRVRTATGEDRHLQADVLARYTDDGVPLHLRCHFFDITERVATERELRHRTGELSQANERLRQINANLERLKESYGDLYHQAPVLYFSLDERGHIVACNETLLRTLGYGREDLMGRSYTLLLTPASRQRYLRDPSDYQRSGEIEAQWVKKDGSVLDVWIRTTPLLDETGHFVRSRSAAQDVTERTRLANAVQANAEELRQANDQLRRINQELEEFTYVVSHDLKEPLRTLQAFSNFLAEDYGQQLGPEGQEHINYLIQASRRLGLLIDDLLILSRAGRVTHAPQAFDLAAAIRTVQGDLADLIQRKEAIVRVEGDLPAVSGDPERVMQLLANLVGNGLKYNQNPHPEIVIGQAHGAEAAPGHVALFVRDNGIGIDPRYHQQIFRIFRRLHHREEYDGTGAGLAICKKVVEAHGGRIWIDSALGQGTTFYFTLPGQMGASRGSESAAPADIPAVKAYDNIVVSENISN